MRGINKNKTVFLPIPKADMFITNEARSTDNSSSVGLISSKSANCTAESIDEVVRQTPLIVIVGTALPVGTVSELVLIWWFIRKQNKKPRDNLFIVEQAWKRRDGYHCVPPPIHTCDC